MPSLLVDTNILLLHVVGSWNKALIPDSKRTSGFTEEDFDLLQETLSAYSSLLVTPAILTEVSNLLPTQAHRLLAATMITVFEPFDERSTDFRSVMGDAAFWRLGFTDTMIAVVADDTVHVLTDDVHLYAELASRGITVTNFNHLRSGRVMG